MLRCPLCDREVPADAVECLACGTDTSLWLARDDQVYGPYSLAELQEALGQSRLGEGDRVMVGDRGDWRPLAEFLAATAAPVVVAAPRPVMPPRPEIDFDAPAPAPRDETPPPADEARAARRNRLAVLLSLGLVLVLVGSGIRQSFERNRQRRIANRTATTYPTPGPTRVNQPMRTSSG